MAGWDGFDGKEVVVQWRRWRWFLCSVGGICVDGGGVGDDVGGICVDGGGVSEGGSKSIALVGGVCFSGGFPGKVSTTVLAVNAAA